MKNLNERKTTYTTNISISQLEQLRALSYELRVPLAELIRQGIDLLLKKRGGEKWVQKIPCY